MIQQEIEDTVVIYENFPIKGIKFVDILPLFTNIEVGAKVAGALLRKIDGVLVVPEARGFVITSSANQYGIPVVFLRKTNKMPSNQGDLFSVCYDKEYGTDVLNIRRSDLIASYESINHDIAGELILVPDYSRTLKITIFDDILATGNTVNAIYNVLRTMDLPFKVEIVRFLFIAEIKSLNGRASLSKHADVYSLAKL